MRDELSLRVYLENAAHADRGGWLELPVAPERLDGFMGGVLGVGGGGRYVVADYEPCWFGDVLGSGLEVFSVSSLNLMARCVARARDMAVADGMDGNMFLDMLATGAESEELREPYALAMLASRAGGLSDGWMPYGLPDSWRAGDSTPDELYGAHVACGLMGDDVYSRLSYCMDLEALGRDEAVNAGVTPGMTGYVVDHEPLVPSMRYDGAAREGLEAFASGWRSEGVEYRPFDIAGIVQEGETVAEYTLQGDGTNWGAPVYRCVVGDGFDAGSDVFGVDVLAALEDTLGRIHADRAGMGDFEEVAREVMGVEPMTPESADDDYGSVPLDLGIHASRPVGVVHSAASGRFRAVRRGPHADRMRSGFDVAFHVTSALVPAPAWRASHRCSCRHRSFGFLVGRDGTPVGPYRRGG